MATTYGSFPGVEVTVAGGGITAVAIGSEEKLVIFGAADYQNDGSFSGSDGDEDPLVSDLDGSTETATQIRARRVADQQFGDGSELANGMREALANGANIDYLYGVAPKRYQTLAETDSNQSGTLANAPLFEDNVDDEGNIQNVECTDTTDGDLTVTFTYDGAPAQPSASDTVNINPLTGEFAADASPTGDYEFNYKYLDWNSAFTADDVRDVVNEDETGIYCALTDADSVSTDLESEVSDRRIDDFMLINALSGAEPNDQEVVTTDGESLQSDYSNYQRRDARYDTGDYNNANQSVDADYYYKFAPVRLQDEKVTALGGVGGLFAGNALNNPIYNDQLEDYDNLEQSFTKSDADSMEDENIIPIRQAGSIRVRGNKSTSTETDWDRTFWNRRIADRIILIGKIVGEQIIGQINDEETRNATERLISQEMRSLVADRVIKPNTESDNSWYVDVYPDDDVGHQVNIDIGFTPYDVVKQVEEQITIDT